MLIIRLLQITVIIVYNCLLASWLLVLDRNWIPSWKYRFYAVVI